MLSGIYNVKISQLSLVYFSIANTVLVDLLLLFINIEVIKRHIIHNNSDEHNIWLWIIILELHMYV